MYQGICSYNFKGLWTAYEASCWLYPTCPLENTRGSSSTNLYFSCHCYIDRTGNNGTTSVFSKRPSFFWLGQRQKKGCVEVLCSQLQQNFSYELCYQIELLDTNHVLLTSINSWFSGGDKYRFCAYRRGFAVECEKKVLWPNEVT